MLLPKSHSAKNRLARDYRSQMPLLSMVLTRTKCLGHKHCLRHGRDTSRSRFKLSGVSNQRCRELNTDRRMLKAVLKIRERQGAAGAFVSIRHTEYPDLIEGPADYLE